MNLNQLVHDVSARDLRQHTNDMVDRMLALVVDSRDEYVTFLPVDEEANDTFASDTSLVNLSWTLGHVIAHTTASAEEAAFVAAELARGVPYRSGRSRYEVPWTSVTTIAQCRERLQASRKMRLASLDLWPDPPHLDNTFTSERYPDPINAIARFAMGLQHDDSHLEQIAKIVRQAQTASKAA
jgi:hypothetical protein